MPKIKVLIADDHAMVREGLKLALNSKKNIRVVGEAADGEATIILAEELNPDIILLDISMPKKNGIEVAREIKGKNKKIKIIILTMLDNEKFIIDAMSTGIEGYLFKDSDLKELIEAVEQVYKGNEYLNEIVTEKILSYIRGRKYSSHHHINETIPLSSREIEVMNLIAKGYTSRRAAEKLFISEFTVIKHRKNIIKKLGVKNFTEAVSYAIIQGII